MRIIRKLSVGRDYPNGSIHYQVGKEMNLMGEAYRISAIVYDQMAADKFGYKVYIEGGDTTLLWKEIIDMPVHVEMDITYA